MTAVNGTEGTRAVKLPSGKVVRFTIKEIHDMIKSLHAGEEMYHMADNIPKWIMVVMMKMTGEPNFTEPMVAATIATLEAMIARRGMLIITDDGFTIVSMAAYESQQRFIESLYNTLSGAAFEEFMDEDGPFMSHIRGDEGCLSKDDIMLEIERIFKIEL